jgi:uncharacterized protein (DUF1778 family)
MPRKPKAEPSQHGGYRTGVEGGKGTTLNVQLTHDDRELIRAAALAAGYTQTAPWVMSVLIPEAQRVLTKKAT